LQELALRSSKELGGILVCISPSFFNLIYFLNYFPMDIFYNSLFPSGLHFQRTIYSIFLAVVSLHSFLNPCFGQEIGAYKTRASGDFNQPSTWDVWDGRNWTNANRLPGATTDIYVDRAHTLRLTAPEAVKNLFLFSGTGAGQKLNLNGFNLDVYGVLAGFSGTVPGTPRGAWNSQNWIGNSPSSTLTFKGQSRVIMEKTSWSAQTTQSRFGVIFDPAPDQELALLAARDSRRWRLGLRRIGRRGSWGTCHARARSSGE
jgi:hypothetical protein